MPDEATNVFLHSAANPTVVCDNNFNCSATLAVKPGQKISWSIQAVSVIDNRTFYSYPLRGEYTGCEETRIVTTAAVNTNMVKPGIGRAKSELMIYPNPTTGELTLKWSDTFQGNANITIMDATGKAVKQLNINKQLPDYLDRITVSNLTAGLYFMHIRMENGKTISTRFVKN